ncbi:hypothetical protein AMS68_006144 [Peltaster fructicola]|uniref:Major facilitator superfamily (MFS) profile domain-containing protein n=1 Tax=Peltaster fructicola TaxID=286661 RepID=A0A6H0Y0U5_9PEZI|nr:hypothetical protein AMS68_006144 [Peltaster fructicola]
MHHGSNLPGVPPILPDYISRCALSLYGYDQGDLAGLLTNSPFRSEFPQIDTISSPKDSQVAIIQGITVAAWNLACVSSATITIFWGDLIGRKNTIFIGLTFLVVGEIIQCSSYSFGQFIAGRCVAGFGNGFNTATIPAWQAECTKAHRRGTLLMISAGACIAAGISFSYWISFAFAFLDSSAAWRAPIAIQLAFALVTMLLLTVMPESPRWLILTGREEKALKTLSALNNLDAKHEQIHAEFLTIKDAVLEMAQAKISSAFTMGDYRHVHRTILAVVLQIFQQMTGINLILQYFPLMLIEQYGYEPWVARLIAAGAGTEFFLASFVAVVGIDRFWGRRSLMLFGATGMCASMVVLCIMAYLDTSYSRIVGTVFLAIFNTFFAIGWQGMSWLYQVEVVPLRIRGAANALSTGANWTVNFVVVFVTPLLFARIGYRTYIIFACTNFVIIPVIYFFYPETGYRCLEEIDVIFHTASLSPNPWLNVRKIAAKQPLWYGRAGDEPFSYEQSDWHQQHLGDVTPPEKQVSDSDDRTLTMSTNNPTKLSSTHSMSSPERPGVYPEVHGNLPGEEACPAPFVPRISSEQPRKSVKRTSVSSWRS